MACSLERVDWGDFTDGCCGQRPFKIQMLLTKQESDQTANHVVESAYDDGGRVHVVFKNLKNEQVKLSIITKSENEFVAGDYVNIMI